MYRLPDDRSRYGSFDKLAEDAENQIREILEDDYCPAEKSHALYASFLDVDAIKGHVFFSDRPGYVNGGMHENAASVRDAIPL